MFGIWSTRWAWVVWAALSATALVAFNRLPGIDLDAARLFWRDGAFAWGAMPVLGNVRSFFHYLPPTAGVALVVLLISRLWRGASATDTISRRLGAAIAAIVAGPLLLVNGLLKEVVDRPRPHQLTEFGGPFDFVPAGDWTGACQSNCSFVSGEVSGIAWLVALLPLCPPAWRPLAGVLIVAAIATSAVLRMAFGAHFLSDVTLSALFTVTVYAIVARLFEPAQAGRR